MEDIDTKVALELVIVEFCSLSLDTIIQICLNPEFEKIPQRPINDWRAYASTGHWHKFTLEQKISDFVFCWREAHMERWE